MKDELESIFQGRTWVDKVLAYSVAASFVLLLAPMLTTIIIIAMRGFR